jgi:hypothetical protein
MEKISATFHAINGVPDNKYAGQGVYQRYRTDDGDLRYQTVMP